MMNFTHLEIVPGGERITPDTAVNAPGGALLYARYDLERIRKEVTPQDIARGPSSLWRYAPLLPLRDPANIVTLGEGWTPLLRADRLGQSLGCDNLWIKDEGRNPSGTFKDRGAAVALSRYRELGVKSVALNSSGNAGGSWGLYAARAGIECVNVLPTDAQDSSRRHSELSGARTYYVDNWHDSGKIVADGCARHGWFNVCTLKEPYRTEGKKTMGLEIAEQLGWQLPDVIVYPMGGGLGAIAIWKAFEELLALGWVTGPLPRLLVTQFTGCAPLVKAFDEGKDTVEPWGKLDVPSGGLKSTNPPAGAAVLAILRKHGGGAIAVDTADAIREVGALAEREGIFACPESATTITGVRKALASGIVKRSDRIVVVCTGSGLKSIPTLPARAEQRIETAADFVKRAMKNPVRLVASFLWRSCAMKVTPAVRTALLVTAFATVSSLPASGVFAQDGSGTYPNRPIRLIVPFGPGGGSDYVGRLVGQKLTEQMGQTVVVDNRPGAASLVGTEMVARAAPDGYTLCLCDVGFTINPAFYKKTAYDPLRDFDPITVVAETPYLLVVNASLPYAGSIKDFIAAAKAQPGTINLGSAGSGSGTHFAGELFKQRAGLTITHVPYKSAGLSSADVASGQIQATMSTAPASMPIVKTGRIKILASASAKRSALMPDIPTFAESGVPGVLVTNWYSVMSRGGTPPAVIRKLHDELTRAIQSPDMRTRLANAALEPAPNTPEQFRKMIAAELQRWARVMKDAGIKQE